MFKIQKPRWSLTQPPLLQNMQVLPYEQWMLVKACTKRLMLYTVASVVLSCTIVFFWKYYLSVMYEGLFCEMFFCALAEYGVNRKLIRRFLIHILRGSLYLLSLPSSIEGRTNDDKRILLSWLIDAMEKTSKLFPSNIAKVSRSITH
jgi:hypothetical protein